MSKKILILCTGNSCRSQMAHGFIQHYHPNLEVYSAGIETHGVNPTAIKVMEEKGVDISNHTSNHLDEYRNISFDLVLTVCDNAAESCPVFPKEVKKLHAPFPDPPKLAQNENSPEKKIDAFRMVRDQIDSFSKEFEL